MHRVFTLNQAQEQIYNQCRTDALPMTRALSFNKPENIKELLSIFA